jgi:hypothetical protein
VDENRFFGLVESNRGFTHNIEPFVRQVEHVVYQDFFFGLVAPKGAKVHCIDRDFRRWRREAQPQVDREVTKRHRALRCLFRYRRQSGSQDQN